MQTASVRDKQKIFLDLLGGVTKPGLVPAWRHPNAPRPRRDEPRPDPLDHVERNHGEDDETGRIRHRPVSPSERLLSTELVPIMPHRGHKQIAGFESGHRSETPETGLALKVSEINPRPRPLRLVQSAAAFWSAPHRCAGGPSTVLSGTVWGYLNESVVWQAQGIVGSPSRSPL